jgi:hypothetical protein
MATEPRYTFDPVTQTYKRIDTPVTTPVRGLGPLYDAGGGDNVSAPSGSRGPGQGISPTAQAIGLGGLAYGNMLGGFMPGGTLANVVGGAVADQQLGALGEAQSNLSTMDAGPGRGMGIATVSDPAGNTYGRSSPASIAAADEATFGLAAMNAQQAAQNQVNTQQASVANTANAIAGAVVGADPTVSVSDPAVDAAENAAAAVADSGGDGGGIGSDGMGGFSDAGGEGPGGPGNAAGTAGVGDGEREGGMIRQRNYKAGGLASAAQHVQSQGRGDDKVLVHMTPGEVRGLQAIAMQHGGSLTINPETGLVEAGFLDSILPMVAGAALTIGSGGVINPYMSAAIVGGVTGLTSGSLEKGLMAGLGAFGGAGIGTALAAPAVTGTQAGLQAAGQQALGTTALPAGVTAGGGAQASALMQQNIAMGMTPAEAAAQIAGSASYAPAAAANIPASIASPTAAQMAATNAAVPPQTMTQGLKSLIQDAPGSRAAFMKEVGGATGLASKAAMAAAPLAGDLFSDEEPDTGGKKPQEYVRPYSFDFNRADADPEFKYRTGAPGESTAEQRYFAPEFKGLGVYKAGTEPGPSFYGKPTAEQLALYSKPKDSPLDPLESLKAGGFSPLGLKAGGLAGLGRGGLRDGAFIVPADVVAHLGNGSNDAGQKILARGLGARPIKGKGDGMSDSIATSIEGKQPARVADGEAYIPPEVVKKVGSKRLYAMMDKIRQARTGTKKQAPEVNPRQFMPA